MLENLFIYGTLGPGRPNEHILNDIGGSWQDATITGTLQQKGWGAEMGYPGIVLNNNTKDKVEGFIFSSENLIDNWTQLDEFEGDEYKRVLIKATLNDGTYVNAYIYALR